MGTTTSQPLSHRYRQLEQRYFKSETLALGAMTDGHKFSTID